MKDSTNNIRTAYIYESKYGKYSVVFDVNHFANGGKVFRLIDTFDFSPVSNCNVWVEGLAEDEIAVKNYSENEGMLNFLVENNICEVPHRNVSSGYVVLPICKLTEKGKLM